MPDEKLEQSDPGFRIVDRRQRSAAEGGRADQSAEGGPAADAEASAAAEAAAREAARAEPGAGETAAASEEEAPLEPADVYAIVEYCITLLNAHAWQAMGLVVNPLTRKAERDLEQARVAIDCVEALFKQVETRLPAAEAQQFRQALTNLRVNFVNQSSKQG